jgi:hypothetical protein
LSRSVVLISKDLPTITRRGAGLSLGAGACICSGAGAAGCCPIPTAVNRSQIAKHLNVFNIGRSLRIHKPCWGPCIFQSDNFVMSRLSPLITSTGYAEGTGAGLMGTCLNFGLEEIGAELTFSYRA